MAQTKAGIEKQRQTNIKKFGSEEAFREHMRNIGAQGGKKSEGWFRKGDPATIEAARKGGKLSKPGTRKNG